MNQRILKFILVLLSLLVTTLSFAQISITPLAGVGAGSRTFRFDGEHPREFDFVVRPRLVIEVGAFVSFPVGDALGINTGLLIQTRNSALIYETELFDEPLRSVTTAPMNYVEIPLGIQFKPDPDGGLVLDAGLGIAPALGGKSNSVATYDGEREEESERLKFEQDDESLLRTDLRLYVGARVAVAEGIQLGVKASLGIRNISFDPDDTFQNHALTIFIAKPIEVDN